MVSFVISDLKAMNESLKEFAEYLRLMRVDEEDVFASRLVSCELITNVIIHSGQAAEFRGELAGADIAISVIANGMENVDLNPSLPDAFAESGRGMYIVNCICGGNVERRDGGLPAVIKKKK